MLKNLNIYGVIFSQKVLLLLVEKVFREKRLIVSTKKCASSLNTQNGNFKQNLERDNEIMDFIDQSDQKNVLILQFILIIKCTRGEVRYLEY